MKKMITTALTLSVLSLPLAAHSHCQMPCGIYHDGIVLAQVDEYIETMNKAVSELDHLSEGSVKERAQFVRWVIEKDQQSDTIAELMLAYFLQQKVKPGEEGSDKMTQSLHKLLFLLVKIKQNTDKQTVADFASEWSAFKKLYAPERVQNETGGG